MANQQIKVDILFGADISAAQQNIQKLGQLLNQISNAKIGFSSGPIAQAAKDAQQLQIHLSNAMNVNTGKLDLTKLNTSLSRSKLNLSQLTNSLLTAGPAGQQAFSRIAMAIAQAENPAIRLNAKVKSLMNTLGNTVKWQIASTAIHAVQGAFQQSIQYIEKFDKAMTDIAIVSDLTTQQLEKFAQSTHKIAREINQTSLEVAEGAAIFYQQGLDTAQVEERVKVVGKMANITRESADTVSSQMTAIWNNFDDGTKSLESYADILSYLGAQTAADTNQIATAMEKFAASAKNVGLSYEFASAAVAEVISKTQMAPEEVGTAFKTILSRMQGLELGETLDDGVNLNKYGEALSVVGVQVLDVNGKLRDADTILQELGTKWSSLDSAQQKALATTVAGVRQQTQFMALMNAWPDVEQSVGELANTTGYLNEQNEKYANSIGGIKKQLEQAKNELFETAINEDFMKGVLKSFTSVIKVVNDFVDAMGGIGPMVLIVAGLFSRTLVPIIQSAFSNLIYNVQTAFGITEKKTKAMKAEFMSGLQQQVNSGQMSQSTSHSLVISSELITAKDRINEKIKYGTALEKEQAALEMKMLEHKSQELQVELDILATSEKKSALIERELARGVKKSNLDPSVIRANTKRDFQAEIERQKMGSSDEEKARLDNYTSGVMKTAKRFSSDELQEKIARKKEQIKSSEDKLQEFANERQIHIKEIGNSKRSSDKITRVKKLEGFEAREKEDIARNKRELEVLEGAQGFQQRQGFRTNKNTILGKTKTSIGNYGDTQTAAYEEAMAKTGATITKGINSTGMATLNTTMDASISNFKKLSESYGEVTSRIQQMDTMDLELSGSIEQVENAMIQLNGVVDENGNKVELTAIDQKKLQEALKNGTNDAKMFGIDLKKAATSLLGMKGSEQIIAKIDKALEQLDSDNPEKVKSALEVLQGSLYELQGAAETAQAGLSENMNQIKIDLEKAGFSSEALEKAESAFVELGFSSEEAKIKVEQFTNELRQSGAKSAMTFGQGLSNLAGGLGQMASSFTMAFSSVQMLKNAFDEGSTAGEKIMGIFTAASMLLPALTMLLNKNTWATMSQSAASMLSALGFKSMGAAAAGAAPGIWAATYPLLIIVGILAVLAAGIFAIVKAVQAAKANSPEGQLKKQQELVEELTKSYENATEAVNKFKDNASNYTEAINGLKGLTQGTLEYREAVREANEYAMQLINSYPQLLAGQYEVVNGIIKINDDALKQAEQQMLNIQLGAAQAVNQAKAVAIDMEHDIKENAIKENDKITYKDVADNSNINANNVIPGEDPRRSQGAYNSRAYNSNEDNNNQQYVEKTVEGIGEKYAKYVEGLTEENEKASAYLIDSIESWVNKNYSDEVSADTSFLDTAVNAISSYSTEVNALEAATQAQKEAVWANTQALLGEKYTPEQVDKYGAGVLTGAENILADQWMDNYSTVSHGVTLGTGDQNAQADFFDIMSGLANNKEIGSRNVTIDALTKDIFSKLLGVSSDALAGYTIKKDGDILTMKDPEGNVVLQGSRKDINRRAALTQINSSDVINAIESGGQEFSSRAQQSAIESGVMPETEITYQGNITSLQGIKADTTGRFLAAFPGEQDSSGAYQLNEDGQRIADYMGEDWTTQAKEQFLERAISQGKDFNPEKERIESTKLSYASQANMDLEAFELYTEELIKNNTALEDNKELAYEVAKEQIDLQKKVKNVGDVYAENEEALKSLNKRTPESLEAAKNLATELNKVFNSDFDTEYIANNLDNIIAALNGNAEAFNILQRDAVASIMAAEQGVEQLEQETIDMLTNIANAEGIEIGELIKVGESSIADDLNEIYKQAALQAYLGGASVEDAVRIANERISNLGFQVPDVKMVEQTVTVTGELPDGWEPQEGGSIIGPDGEEITGVKWTEKEGGTYTYTMTMMVPEGGMQFAKTSESLGSSFNSGKGGGGSNNKPKSERGNITRYDRSTHAIDKQNLALDKLNSAKDKAWGPERLKYINDEIKGQEELLKLYEQQSEEAKNYYDEDFEELQSKVKEVLDIEVKSDTEGFIENQVAIEEALLTYENSHLGDETVEENASLIRELLEDTEESAQKIIDIDEERFQISEEIQDMVYEAYEIMNTYWHDLVQNHRDYIEWQRKYMSEDNNAWKGFVNTHSQTLTTFQAQAEGLEYSLGTSLSNIGLTADIQKYGSATEAFLNMSSEKWQTIPENWKSAIEETIVEYRDMLGEMYDGQTEIFELFGEEIENLSNKITENLNKIEGYTSSIEFYLNTVDLIGKNKLGINEEWINSMYDASIKMEQTSLQVAKANKDFADSNLKQIQEQYNLALKGTDVKLLDYWKEQLDQAVESAIEARGELESTLTAVIEAATKAFTTVVELAAEKFEEALSGDYNNLSDLEAAYEREKDLADLYVEDYKKIYELSKLSRQIENSINDTDNIKSKKILRDLEKQVVALQEDGAEVSQYQLNYLQKQYDLRLAQIALEEAQNAKNQVRLTRDSEGNYSYTYTANEDSISDAEQKYEDALYASQELSSEYIKEMESNLMATERGFVDAIKELDPTDADYEKKYKELEIYYSKKWKAQADEINKALGYQKVLYDEDWYNYSMATGYKISEDNKFIDSLNEMNLSTLGNFDSLDDRYSALTSSMSTMSETIRQEYVSLGETIKEAMTTAGFDITNFGEQTRNIVYGERGFVESAETISDAATKEMETAKSAFTDMVEEVGKQYDNFQTYIDKYKDKIQELNNKLMEMQYLMNPTNTDYMDKMINAFISSGGVITEEIKSLNDLRNAKLRATGGTDYHYTDNDANLQELLNYLLGRAAERGYSPSSNSSSSNNNSETNTSSPVETLDVNNLKVGNYVLMKSGEKGNASSDGSSSSYHKFTEADTNTSYKIYSINPGAEYPYAIGRDGVIMCWIKPSQINRAMDSYDTGGYTGSWDSSGRLAMLHQKELVLNANDTENFLLATDILREITRAIDLQAWSAQYSNAMAATISGNKNSVEQDVHIEASFPNVTDHNEIELALTNLINDASQYAFNKNF